MCGICGILKNKAGHPPEVDHLKRMMALLRHRGPDSSGYYRDHHAALGHLRLSIIDLATGDQPLSNEDSSLWIVFNGEIFNYLELRRELIDNGHHFRTQSDTEVIVHAYEQWGKDCFTRFNGQWALALWDTRTRELMLSRDRVGIRPLYYTQIGDTFLFASEIKSLLSYPEVPREFDPAGLAETFTFWSPIAPRTVFKGIKELQPGHICIYKDRNLNIKPYWELTFPPAGTEKIQNEAEAAERLRDTLIQAAKLRFERSDVPVGAYLSGGIDSSVTAAVINRYTDAPLKTFSIRFEDSEFDEGDYQQTMIERLGTDHSDIVATYQDIGNVFPDVVWHAERPLLRTAPAPMFLLSRLVRNSNFKVVVTGEGADEILGGYDLFREAKVRQFLSRDPSSAKRAEILSQLYPWMERSPEKAPAFARSFFGKNLDPSDPGFSHHPRWNATMGVQLLCTPDMRNAFAELDPIRGLINRFPTAHQSWDLLCRSQWLEITSLLSPYILSAQGDRMLMANSVEGRFPFIDPNVIQLANSLPARYKLFALNEKHLLKNAFRDLIPQSILNRPKKPYRAPDAASFFPGTKLDWLEFLTSESQIKNANLFNPKAVTTMVNKSLKNKGTQMSNTDNMRMVAIASSQLLHDHFIADSNGKFDASVELEVDTIIELLITK